MALCRICIYFFLFFGNSFLFGESLLVIELNGKAKIDGNSYSCSFSSTQSSVEPSAGTGTIPVGSFPVRGILWREDRLTGFDTQLPIKSIDATLSWNIDPGSSNYNQLTSGENSTGSFPLWIEEKMYDLVVMIGYNDHPPSSQGNGPLFLCLEGKGQMGHPAVFFKLEDLESIVTSLKPDTKIIIRKPLY